MLTYSSTRSHVTKELQSTLGVNTREACSPCSEEFKLPWAPNTQKFPRFRGFFRPLSLGGPDLFRHLTIENTKENLQNTKDFSYLPEPLKTCKISRKHSKRPRKFPGRKTPKKQKKQGKEGQGRPKLRPRRISTARIQKHCKSVGTRNSDQGPSFFPGETQTMVGVNCQNGDGGGSWVGDP